MYNLNFVPKTRQVYSHTPVKLPRKWSLRRPMPGFFAWFPISETKADEQLRGSVGPYQGLLITGLRSSETPNTSELPVFTSETLENWRGWQVTQAIILQFLLLLYWERSFYLRSTTLWGL